MATEIRRITVTAVDGHTAGIRADRLDGDALDEALEMRGLDGEVTEETSREQKAVIVFMHMIEGDKEKKWECVKCARCDGAFDESFPFCPYCGDGLEEHHEKSDEEDDDQPATAVVESRASTPSVLAGGSSTAMVPTSKSTTGMSVVKKVAGGVVKYSIRDLDAAVEEVARLKGVIGVGFWDLGSVIAGVYDNNIWRLRTREDGKSSLYKTWDAFCQAEFKMLHQSALNAMDIHRRFPRAYAEKYGRSKLAILVRAHSEEDLKEMQVKMEEGASVRELKEMSKAKVDEKREKGEPIERRKKTAEGEVVATPMRLPKKRPDGTSTKKPKAPSSGKVTVAAIEGTKGIAKVWARKQGKISKVLSDTSELSRAKKLADDGIFVIELKNSVSIYCRILDRDDGLAVQYEVGRDDEGEE